MSQEWDWDTLLAGSLKVGLSIDQFWALTPRETQMTLEAAAWRAERERERGIVLAWTIAGLQRAKTLPPLKRLLHPPRAQRLTPRERAERQREYDELVERMLKAKPGAREGDTD